MFSSVHKRWAWRDNRSNRRRQIQTRLANFSFNWERERCVRNTTGSGRCWLFNSLFCFIKLSLSCQVSSVQQASELFIDIQIACFFSDLDQLPLLSVFLSFFQVQNLKNAEESKTWVGDKRWNEMNYSDGDPINLINDQNYRRVWIRNRSTGQLNRFKSNCSHLLPGLTDDVRVVTRAPTYQSLVVNSCRPLGQDSSGLGILCARASVRARPTISHSFYDVGPTANCRAISIQVCRGQTQ